MTRYVCFLFLVTSFTCASAETCRQIPPNPVFISAALDEDERRVAFVAGVGDYDNLELLANPPSDALALSDLYSELGFEVFVSIDGTAEHIMACLQTFEAAASEADIAIVHFSGHGIQRDDNNLLAAKDADISSSSASGFVPMQSLSSSANAATFTLVFIDACRTDPDSDLGLSGDAAANSRSISRGLSAVDADEVIASTTAFVAYATGPGQTAADGDGEYSPFTQALLDNLGEPGMPLSAAMVKVADRTADLTSSRQVPWTRSSMRRELYLGGYIQAEGGSNEVWQALVLDFNMELAYGNRKEAVAALLRTIPEGLENHPEIVRIYGPALSQLVHGPIINRSAGADDFIVEASPDGQTFAIWETDWSETPPTPPGIRLIDASDLLAENELPFPFDDFDLDAIVSLGWSSSGRSLVASQNNKLAIIDASGDGAVRTIRLHDPANPDERYIPERGRFYDDTGLFVAVGEVNWSPWLAVFDASTGALLHKRRVESRGEFFRSFNGCFYPIFANDAPLVILSSDLAYASEPDAPSCIALSYSADDLRLVSAIQLGSQIDLRAVYYAGRSTIVGKIEHPARVDTDRYHVTDIRDLTQQTLSIGEGGSLAFDPISRSFVGELWIEGDGDEAHKALRSWFVMNDEGFELRHEYLAPTGLFIRSADGVWQHDFRCRSLSPDEPCLQLLPEQFPTPIEDALAFVGQSWDDIERVKYPPRMLVDEQFQYMLIANLNGRTGSLPTSSLTLTEETEALAVDTRAFDEAFPLLQ